MIPLKAIASVLRPVLGKDYVVYHRGTRVYIKPKLIQTAHLFYDAKGRLILGVLAPRGMWFKQAFGHWGQTDYTVDPNHHLSDQELIELRAMITGRKPKGTTKGGQP
jgi:hypothetical protein